MSFPPLGDTRDKLRRGSSNDRLSLLTGSRIKSGMTFLDCLDTEEIEKAPLRELFGERMVSDRSKLVISYAIISSRIRKDKNPVRGFC